MHSAKSLRLYCGFYAVLCTRTGALALHKHNRLGLCQCLLQPTHLACMQQAGCEIDQNFFRVENCDAQAGGGFRPPDGVRVVLLNS